jgi:isocitrate/isopropylmalate dehydrogenase
MLEGGADQDWQQQKRRNRRPISRLSRLECKTVDNVKMVIVRGNTPEEHAAEKDRLIQAGLSSKNDWLIFEPRATGQSSSKIIEMSASAFRRMLQAAEGTGKKILEEPRRY